MADDTPPKSKKKFKPRLKQSIVQAENLHALANGNVGRTLDKHIRKMYDDIDMRPRDSRARVMTFTVAMEPGENGIVAISTEIKSKLPSHRPEVTMAKPDETIGGFIFNEESADNIDQMTMGEDEE